jgi:hypothetical protein
MERSFFRQVKEAVAGNAEATLTSLGINLKHGLKGEWSQCLCPFCGDKSGSASITPQGYLRCHQCGRKQDLCDWYAELHNITPWEACKVIAEITHTQLETKKHKGRPPKAMTHEILRGSVHSLWDDEKAESARKFLTSRKLTDTAMLEQFGVGFISGHITFAQWTPTGHLRSCYRVYTPGNPSPWGWRGGSKAGVVGFWPYFNLPKEGEVWVLEGEWDVAIAWMFLRLQDQGIYCTTWTGGAGSPIKPHMIPEAWHGRIVHIIRDNDVFQGPLLEDHKAPDQKKKLELKARWRVLMNQVAPSFLAQNCTVYLRAIPIDPLELWGGDLRDWVDRGGRDLSEITPYLFNDLRPSEDPPVDTEFMGVYALAGKEVKFTTQLSTIDKAQVTVPSCTQLVCDMGSMSYCSQCKAMSRFQNGMIHWEGELLKHLARGLTSKIGLIPYTFRQVVGKPPACVHAVLEHIEYETSSRWTGVHDNEEEASERTLTIISKDTPSLTGEVEVTGRVYHSEGEIMVMASQIHELDRAQINLTPFVGDLLHLCPTTSDSPEEIQAYLDRRYADLSYNVTKVYGRQPLHIAHDLLAHSALWLNIEGIRRRGWLDISIIGDTATAKTETFKRLMDFHHLGTWQNSGENVSRAGLTMGGDRVDGSYKVKPGLFPRNHKKMLILDEFHDAAKQDVLKYLQGARDDGRVFASKIFGSRMMPAAVRFAAIANWPYDRQKFRFLCEHIQAIYGTPECLRRMDLSIIVAGEPTETSLLETPQLWTEELVRAGILRSWAMDETMVHIPKEVIAFAKKKCEEWSGCYAASLPLFTPEEKHLTLLRMAVAIANLCFSHPPGEPYHCQVNLGHIRWAADFLKATWVWSEYEDYSIVNERKKVLDRPFEVESRFSVGLGLSNPRDAELLLPDFLGGVGAGTLGALLGKDQRDTMQWLNKMMRFGVLVHARNTNNGYLSEYRPTKAGDIFLRNMIMLAEEFPDEWRYRHRKLKESAASMRDPSMSPLTDPKEKLRNEWQDRDRQED